MARFRRTVTPGLLIAAVLVLGLLGAGSAALLKGSPDREAGGTTVAAEESLPQILPMPPREAVPEKVNSGSTPQAGIQSRSRGISPSRLQALFADAFGGEESIFNPEMLDWEGLALSDPVTRADAARALIDVLGLADVAANQAPAEPIFRDVPREHAAFAAVALLERLGLYPFHVGTFFAPDEPVAEAELKFTVESALALEMVKGPVVHVNEPARTVSVEWTPRHATAYIAGDGALIVRNGEAATLERLRPGDAVQVVADRDGQLFLAVAEGPASDGASDELLALLRELATPEQLAAIISRDWERAAVELKGSVYKQLLERGATPEEAEALLAKDWTIGEERTKARLTQLITESTDVNEQLVRAVLDRDWETALSFVEVEVLEYVLNYLAV